MRRARVLLLLVFLLLPLGQVRGLDEVVDDYTDETQVQAKDDVVRNTTYNAMELTWQSGVPWLGGWEYRKPMVVQGSSARNLWNYTLQFVTYFGSGTDGFLWVNDLNYGTVYLDGKCQTDFDDIIFADEDGLTVLGQWRESYTASTSAVWWVMFPTLDQSTNHTYYLYYGNAGASLDSDIKEAFLIGDDFDDASIDTDMWYFSGSGSATETGGYLQLTGSSGYYYVVSYNSTYHGYYSKGRMQRTSAAGYTDLGGATNSVQLFWKNNARIAPRIWKSGVGKTYDGGNWLAYGTGWYTWYRKNKMGDFSVFNVGGTRVSHGTDANQPLNLTQTMRWGDYQDAGVTRMDWVFHKLFIQPEPLTYWSPEQNFTALGAGYAATGHYYTTELLTSMTGYSVIFLLNTTIPNTTTLTAEFSTDNATWVEHNNVAGSDSIPAGYEAFDLRDINSTTFYSRLNFTAPFRNVTARIYQIRIISTDTAAGNGEPTRRFFWLFLTLFALILIVGGIIWGVTRR